jgi:hypothetical protein
VVVNGSQGPTVSTQSIVLDEQLRSVQAARANSLPVGLFRCPPSLDSQTFPVVRRRLQSRQTRGWLKVHRIEQDGRYCELHYCEFLTSSSWGCAVAPSAVRQSTLARLDTTEAVYSINVDRATSPSTPLTVVEVTYERYAMYVKGANSLDPRSASLDGRG